MARRNETKPGQRCSWVNLDDTLLVEYHDREWGVPAHSDQTLRGARSFGSAGRIELVTGVEKTRRLSPRFRKIRSRESRALFRKTNSNTLSRCRHHPQPHEDRRCGAQRACIAEGPGRVRRL